MTQSLQLGFKFHANGSRNDGTKLFWAVNKGSTDSDADVDYYYDEWMILRLLWFNSEMLRAFLSRGGKNSEKWRERKRENETLRQFPLSFFLSLFIYFVCLCLKRFALSNWKPKSSLLKTPISNSFDQGSLAK